MSATPSSESSPLPVKKLKQTKLSFHTTIQLGLSTPSTSHHEDDSDQEETHLDEEFTCALECCACVCDEQGLTRVLCV